MLHVSLEKHSYRQPLSPSLPSPLPGFPRPGASAESGSIVPLVPFLPASQAPRTSQPLSAPQMPDIKKKTSKKQPGGGAGIDFRQDVPDLFFSISVIRKAVGL